ncbi:HAD-IIIC family phosphatase [Mucilaginibacter pocheonensis]|uniref:FkbH-like protein n=1 Tax=Mucilaginibacter pocheonensis TaxID=398050 RepID=A0ABU1T542_9SPHI|nr:HAD-IIIC family phosphatase [Mucilaginibacter pocheonensis]MDR6940414.1 FkbH-like protein [Mucilaginibacter pocheonensis]
MLSFSDLKKNLKKETTGLKHLKIALLADTASQFIHTAIKGYGIELGLDLNIYEADYDQIEQQVYDPASDLYAFAPAYVIIIRSTEHLLNKFYKQDDRPGFYNNILSETGNIYQHLTEKLSAKVVINTYVEINDQVFGSYASKTTTSFLYQLRKINIGLMDISRENKDLHITDLASLSSVKGYDHTFDPKMYISADMVFSIDFLPLIAQNIIQIIGSTLGNSKKCLILDLDNTVWGGIIGDDGMEGIQIGNLGIGKAFTQLQLWCRELKNRGIILAVCSKNTEHIAKEPFADHPDMILTLDDITVFVANWENKVDNIRYIQQILNIGFDAMVFLDDNPFEREMLRFAIPDLTVPELPADPADYLLFLRSLNLFDTASYTEDDKHRTTQYQQEAKRSILQKSFNNEQDYLKSLNMLSKVDSFDKFSIPRVAQLTLRSNQFNLRTIRYTETAIAAISSSDEYFTLHFTLEDKLGDHGLIAVVILKKQDISTLFIDTWIMSCRVLKRGMENFTLNHIIKIARSSGFAKIMGEYIPTAKNGLVKDHYKNLGFTPVGETWELQVDGLIEKENFIQQKR